MAKLTVRKVETAKHGKYADGGGLYLVVPISGARYWTFRFMTRGRAREMGLGGVGHITLAEARQKAIDARRALKAGRDPIADRQKASGGVPTFGKIAEDLHASLSSGFRNDKHRAQWINTIKTYAKPLLDKPVDTVTTEDVLACLTSIWTKKAETASRVRGRIERVLNAAKTKGYRSGENPAQWRGHLENLLTKRAKASYGHHAAMPHVEVAKFIGELRRRPALAAHALEFCILTAARSGEVLRARWSEIDLGKKLWTIPRNRMKAGEEHLVPLPERAVAILLEVREAREPHDFVFPGQRRNRPLSNMAMDMILRRMDVDVTVHGFRSSFRDWAGNVSNFPRELAEEALAHVIGSKAERAYRRELAIDKRRLMMKAWAAYIEPGQGGAVVHFRKT